jgi:signal transduction histidine kinase
VTQLVGHRSWSRGRTIRIVNATAGSIRPIELLPRWARWIPLGLYLGSVAIGVARLNPNLAVAVIAALVAAVAGVLLLRTPPRPAFLASAVVATAAVAVLGNGMSSNVGWFAVCLVGGWSGLVARRLDAVVYLAGAIALFGAEWLWAEPDPGWGPWMAGTTLSVLGCLLIRHEIALVSQLREAQAGLADQARAEERNRIARELHDVIAHTLTVSLLHVTSARLAVEYDPDDAARALAEAERLGRESLSEVRSAVGLLRQNGDTAGNAPMPGVNDVPALVERFRSARADVTLTVDGPTDGFPATTGLAVYRILQEALTNAAKHAPGAAIAITLAIDPTGATLTVDSAGPPGQGGGVGLVSMRERAESLGGSCVAGPGGTGWRVCATLPLDPSRSRATT